MNTGAENPGDSRNRSGPAPVFVLRELHGTMHWAILTAVAVLAGAGYHFWSILRSPETRALTEAGADWRLAGPVAGTALLAVSSGWTGWRMLAWFSAILRLRGTSRTGGAEEAIRRQRRLWVSLAVLAAVRLLVQIMELPAAAGSKEHGRTKTLPSPESRVLYRS